MEKAELRSRYRHLVWSNPEAEDAIYIRQALLTGKLGVLADFAAVFGLEALQDAWNALEEEGAAHPVIRREVVHFFEVARRDQ